MAENKGPAAFAFASGLNDCVTSNPKVYSVLAEIPGARLVKMVLPPGEDDGPKHDHPKHPMYFIKAAKATLSPPPGATEGSAEVELPEGAAPIFPPGAHQVKNTGNTPMEVLFVEPYAMCKPCGDVEGFISPFDVSPTCYSNILSEDDKKDPDWVTGILTMQPGEEDKTHHHKDHLIYVLEGEHVTITFGEESMPVPIAAGAGLAAPMSAPPFAKHSLKNTGTTPVKMLFFEMKN